LRGPLTSMLYLGAFLADYWVGYLFVIRPLLARSSFVVFDRYFHDLLVDPRRYRYGGPKWLPRFFSRLVPLPDLVFVLDAGEQVILSRKGEVQIAEVQRQREAYRRLNFGCAPTVLVNTEQSLDRTLYDSTRALTEVMSRRFEQRQSELPAMAL
jgi:thymidylate kinase